MTYEEAKERVIKTGGKARRQLWNRGGYYLSFIDGEPVKIKHEARIHPLTYDDVNASSDWVIDREKK